MKQVVCSYYFLLLAVSLLKAVSATAQNEQADTDFIQSFSRPDVIELYPGIYSTHFNFTGPRERKSDFRLVANSSAYIGTYINYKWASLKYSWAMPGTQLDKNVRLRYTSLSLRVGTRQMAFHPFYDSYNGLLIPEKKTGERYQPFRGIQFSDAGADIYFYTNSKQFSYHAADYFSELQTKSKGSFFMMGTPMWQKINWKNPSSNLISDSTTFRLLSSDPQWLSLIGRIGFSYNFVFQKGKWSIAPAFLIGGGATRQINTDQDRLQAATDVQGWVNAGYNGSVYYFYINAWWDQLQTNLLIKNLRQVNSDFSITAGYRFQHLKKKLLMIL